MFQISGVAALLVMLDRLWGNAPLDRTIILTVAVGATVYSVLLVGQVVVRYVVAHAPEATDDSDEADDSAEAPAPPAQPPAGDPAAVSPARS